ncbi:MAG: ABC transporter ATP-binding protein [Nocardioidaceae bacterium]
MSSSVLPAPDGTTTPTAGGDLPRGRTPVDWRRLKRPATGAALLGSLVAATLASLGSVVAGRLTEEATGRLVLVLALCVVGGALIDTVAKTSWFVIVDRAEGALRADLLEAALAQPLPDLTEQAVGEILDRIDDDTHEVGQLLRWSVWMAARTVLAAGPLWLVAGFTWWPAFLLFPVTAALAIAVARPLLPGIAERKVLEEMAWTDHAAVMEEGVAARDDLRTSLGQAHVMRRSTQLAAEVLRRLKAVLELEVRVTRRTGTLLHALLAGVGIVGVALVVSDQLTTASLVTLFLVTSTFVGQVDMLARHLPDLQAGFGAVLRLRGMLASPAEPEGGRPLDGDQLDVEFRDLHFAYEHGTFALQDVSLQVPAGHTCALVGRTGSGKSTLASLLSRAVEPEPGQVFLGGVDVRELDLQALRADVGVVTQRTEILAGSLVDNVTLFADIPRGTVEAAIETLGLTAWVAGLPDGLDTLLGPGGTSLSAGEEQLVAFARLLVRDVKVVILDEATARMDPVTEARVVAAAGRLLAGRTGLLVAHRLSTIERAEQVAVLERGRVVQHGPRDRLARTEGPFRRLLEASAETGDIDDLDAPVVVVDEAAAVVRDEVDGHVIGTARRTTTPPAKPVLAPTPSLTRTTFRAMTTNPTWGLAGMGLFLVSAITGAFGAITGWVWGHLVTSLQRGDDPWLLVLALVGSLVVSPLLLSQAFWVYPRWWVSVQLSVRTTVLHGQTMQRRLVRTPPGEAVARAMDADRITRYADRWVDLLNGLAIVVITSVVAGTFLAGGILLTVMVSAALASSLGRRIAGRSAAASSAARARFGRSLVSALDSVRTVKLAAATPAIHAHLAEVDGSRVGAAVREHRIQAMLDGVPVVMVQAGVVAAWAGLVTGHWGLATTLLMTNAVSGFDWFGRVAGAVVTEAPGVRAWMRATSALAGGGDITTLPPGVDLKTGAAPDPAPAAREPLRELRLRRLTAVHDDGTVGVSGVDLTVASGELVLLLGQVGSGKSSLLGALAGLVSATGEIHWNDRQVTDPEVDLRPGRIAIVSQVPRVLSGTFAGNITLDHADRDPLPAIETARLGRDVAEAGGPDALVGHRGVRLSGGQVQRLALARALACDAEVLLADDVSSALDAATEIELWQALRASSATVLGATSKAAALAQADRVVVLADGAVVDQGPWTDLSGRWGHLAG